MVNSVVEEKAKLRKEYKSVRKALGDEKRQQASSIICAQLAGWDIFQKAETILTYMPMRTEVNLLPLVEKFPHKRWLIPRILPDEEGIMVFHPYDPDHLVRHPFGMIEPASDLPQIAPDTIELVLTPGLAFDRTGLRLGYGGGFYDRFLTNFRGVSIGITFHTLLVDRLPQNKFDVPVKWIITEVDFFQEKV